MTCKDCIHYNICSIWSTTDLIDDEADKFCFGNFKPTADVVEVVRCKDCKHFIDDEDVHGLCMRVDELYPPKNHFCSYGERREG